MADPWLDYQQQKLPVPPAAPAGPWQEYQATAGPQSRMPPINPAREGGRLDRAVAGLKFSSEGVANYLEGRYGKGNVATDRDGSFYVKDKGEWIAFDSPSFNTKDLYDLSGLAVAAAPVAGAEAVAARFAAPLAKAVGGGILGGAAGSALQQTVAAATPGGDPMSGQARLTQLLLDAGAGGLGNLAGAGVSRLGSGVRNTYLTQTGQAATPAAQQGKAVSQYLGVPLTPGQTSQRTSLLTLEGALRRSPTKAADIMQQFDEQQLIAGRNRWNQLMDNISRNPANAEMLGNQVIKAFDDTLGAARKVRSQQARADFAAIDSAAGRAPVFQLGDTVKALDDLIARYETPGGGDATAGLARQLRGVRDALIDQQGTLRGRSAQEVQRLMEVYGEAAAGTGKVFSDIETAQQRRIAKQVMDALDQDVAMAANAAAPNSPLAAALQNARQNYRLNSQALEELRKSGIGQYLGLREHGAVTPELVAERVVGMKPSQMRQTFQLLDTADPELSGAAKRYALEKAMLAAEPSAERIADRLAQGAAPEGYSPARLLGELAKSPIIDALSPQEKFGLAQLNAAMQRLANRGGTEGSPTAPLGWAFDIAKNIATAGLAGDAVGAFKLATMVVAPKKLAEAITSPNSFKALRTLTLPKPGREALLGALATLGALDATRTGRTEDVRPFAMPPTPAASGTQGQR